MQNTRYWLFGAVIIAAIVGFTVWWNADYNGNNPYKNISSKSVQERTKAIQKFGKSKDRSSIPLLIARVKDVNENPKMKGMALRTIGTIGGQEAFIFLTQTLNNQENKDTIRGSAASAIAQSNHLISEDVLLNALNQEEKLAVQLQILRALAKFEGANVENSLTAFIAGENDPKNEAFALNLLLKLNGENAVPLILEELDKSNDSQIQIFFLQLIAQKKDQRAIEPIFQLLDKSKDPNVQRAAIIVLAQLKAEKAAPKFATLLQETDDPLTGSYLVGAFNLLEDKQGVTPILSFYDKMKKQAADYTPTSKEEDLKFHQSNLQARGAIIQTLSKLDLQQGINIYKDVLNTPINETTKIYWTQLKKLALQNLAQADQEGAYNYIQEKEVLQGSDIGLKLSTIQLLSKWNRPDSKALLIPLLNDKNDAIAIAALKATAQYDDEDTQKAIRELANSPTASDRLKRAAKKLIAN